jgi:DNA-binding response OmpR family regulator
VEGELVIAKAVPRIPSKTRSSDKQLILVADDDRSVASVAQTYLLLAGFESVIADSGEEALAKAIELKPDLVVLDVMMPRMDGYEVCAKLREDGRTQHIPVIFLSAKTLRADRVYGLTIGDDYIVKPFDPDELVARVRAVLRRT